MDAQRYRHMKVWVYEGMDAWRYWCIKVWVYGGIGI